MLIELKKTLYSYKKLKAFTFFQNIQVFKLLEQRKAPPSILPEKQMVCPYFKTTKLESTPP